MSLQYGQGLVKAVRSGCHLSGQLHGNWSFSPKMPHSRGGQAGLSLTVWWLGAESDFSLKQEVEAEHSLWPGSSSLAHCSMNQAVK